MHERLRSEEGELQAVREMEWTRGRRRRRKEGADLE